MDDKGLSNAVLAERMEHLARVLEAFQQSMEKNVDKLWAVMTNDYVTKTEFKLVQTIVYRAVGLVLTSFLLGVIGLVIVVVK